MENNNTLKRIIIPVLACFLLMLISGCSPKNAKSLVKMAKRQHGDCTVVSKTETDDGAKVVLHDKLQDFDYKTSIDNDVYNRIKLAVDNEETGEREFYITNGTENQEQWGILQYYDKLDDNAGDIALRGQMLLNHYNLKARSLKLNKVFGNAAVRGGSAVTVNLNIGDIVLSSRMLVEEATHRFSGGHYFMDLTLSGRGEFR